MKVRHVAQKHYMAAWGSLAALSVAGFGIKWALTTVEVPVIWLFVIAFVPMLELVNVVTGYLDKLDPSTDGERR